MKKTVYSNMINLDLVIVTYNRLEKLKKALACYEQQTASFRNLIVVDNCSTDGTAEFLDKWQSIKSGKFQKIVNHSPENVGGSGGFHLGQKKAMELGADWVFVADDDAYAAPNMIEEFYRFTESHDASRFSAICAAVKNMDGSIAPYHRDRVRIEPGDKWPYKKFFRDTVKDDEYESEFFTIDLLSYVGAFLNAKSLRKSGLVDPSFFIFFDDSEHSLRLRKCGKIIVVPKMEIMHEGGNSETKKDVLVWRYYYQVRNETRMLLKHYPRTAIKGVLFELRRIVGRKLHHAPYNQADLLTETAVWDALWCNMGKHKKYKPGWECKI